MKAAFLFIALCALCLPAPAPAFGQTAGRAVPAEGLAVNEFAKGLGAVEAIAVHAPSGDVFALDSRRGRVLRLRDRTGAGQSQMKSTYLSGFDRPSGLAITDTRIFVSDAAGIWTATLTGGLAARKPARLLADLTRVETAVIPRPIAVTAGGESLLIGLGALTDRSNESAPAASVVKVDIATGKASLYASGLKQVTALQVLKDGKVAALVSEEAPAPDYMALISQGGFYGWPYAYGAQVPVAGTSAKDPYKIITMREPLFDLGARKAGTAFLMPNDNVAAPQMTGRMIAIVGERSLNITAIDLSSAVLGSDALSPALVLGGFQPDRARAWAEPSALAFDTRGALLVGDRLTGTIWRVTQAPVVIESEPQIPDPEIVDEAKPVEDEPVTFRTQNGRTRQKDKDP